MTREKAIEELMISKDFVKDYESEVKMGETRTLRECAESAIDDYIELNGFIPTDIF